MNRMNFLRLVSVALFWFGFLMTGFLGMIFLIRPNWNFQRGLLLVPADWAIALALFSVLPFIMAVVARYLSKT